MIAKGLEKAQAFLAPGLRRAESANEDTRIDGQGPGHERLTPATFGGTSPPSPLEEQHEARDTLLYEKGNRRS
jgi:hypothetical protein